MRSALLLALLLAVLSLPGCASAPPAPEASAAVAVALDPATPVEWVPEVAELFAQEVPKAVQKLAKKEMEKQARLRGQAIIDRALYDQIKQETGH